MSRREKELGMLRYMGISSVSLFVFIIGAHYYSARVYIYSNQVFKYDTQDDQNGIHIKHKPKFIG